MSTSAGPRLDIGRNGQGQQRVHRFVAPCDLNAFPPVFPPIQPSMVHQHQPLRESQSKRAQGAYVLVVRGRDGRPRFEQFDDAAAYKARLASLHHSNLDSVSIDEIVALLDL
jgi:hypothetical protein